MPKDSPENPSSSGDANQEACETTTSCPLQDYEIVELVEVVTQGSEKWVKGAAMNCSDSGVFPASVERKDKDGSNFKQFINLDHDLEGTDKRHPEYGRVITFKAKIRQKNDATDKLAGISVDFGYKRTDGPDRTNPGGTDPDIWSGTDLTGDQKDGFSSAGGSDKITVKTDGKGWTSEVSLYLSKFGGDQYEVACNLAKGTPGAETSQPKKTQAKYVVWRRFWYQLTHADGYNAPQPTNAESAFAETFAEMQLANTLKFKKDDFPDDLKGRTFYKEYMLKQGGADKDVANVGDDSNISEFRTNAKLKMTTDAKTPVKENLIVCEYQCDPKPLTQNKIYKLTSAGQTVTLGRGSGGPIVCKPPIKAGAKLVAVGEWSKKRSPWAKEGDITDANIEIDKSRASTLAVKINLPSGAPTPTSSDPIYVKLRVETAKNFLGWATSSGIVAVYRPAAASGKSGSEEDFNDTAAHEFGHKWNQSPKPGKQPDSLKDHPLQYVAHGGSGSHCRHGASVASGPVNWQDVNENTPSPQDGDCIMYHRYSSKCSHKFCKTCKPYLQLQDMSSF